MLSDKDFLRYQRQVALPEIAEQGQERLLRSTVLIIGCGGLGNIAALYLAASGVGNLILVDDDVVEDSNLQRQIAYRETDLNKTKVSALAGQIGTLNSSIRVRTIGKRIGEQQLSIEVMLADVVLDCTDNFESRHLINRICFAQSKPLISGAAVGWSGQFAIYDYSVSDKENCPCYQCLVPEEESPNDRNCSTLGVMGPVVGTIGNYQSIAAIQKLALGKFLASTNTLHLFEAKNMVWQTFEINKDKQCPICSGVTE
ncbi:HesA/MoeB/ThiF family protein [Vibrio sonorensis]|uniref:HesA/MoeB/ThiF family protein n=1 Tax=Vibrio sonorensis TaxID=1004316 RepID=UPI0008DAFBA4|nr:HesA/MoeB/ThiF family protein [Vibrio sonorensis]